MSMSVEKNLLNWQIFILRFNDEIGNIGNSTKHSIFNVLYLHKFKYS